MQTRDRKNRKSIRKFETSPETIEQELRAAVCEKPQTDLINENYSTAV